MKDCKACKGAGFLVSSAFTSLDGVHYPESSRKCNACDGRKQFPEVNETAIREAIMATRGKNKGKLRSVMTSDFSGSIDGARAYYVWRLARWHGGKDMTMPMNADLASRGDPYKDDLEKIASAVAKESFGSDMRAALTWGRAFGLILVASICICIAFSVSSLLALPSPGRLKTVSVRKKDRRMLKDNTVSASVVDVVSNSNNDVERLTREHNGFTSTALVRLFLRSKEARTAPFINNKMFQDWGSKMFPHRTFDFGNLSTNYLAYREGYANIAYDRWSYDRIDCVKDWAPVYESLVNGVHKDMQVLRQKCANAKNSNDMLSLAADMKGLETYLSSLESCYRFWRAAASRHTTLDIAPWLLSDKKVATRILADELVKAGFMKYTNKSRTQIRFIEKVLVTPSPIAR